MVQEFPEPLQIDKTKLFDLPDVSTPEKIVHGFDFRCFPDIRKLFFNSCLEKTHKGTVSYLPENHEFMVKAREEKIARIADEIPDLKVSGNPTGDLLVVSWGGSYGYLMTAVRELQSEGKSVSLVNFNYINPLPKNVKEVFSRFKKIVVCELNLGQFANYLRMKHQEFQYEQYNKVQGVPFTIQEIKEKCTKLLEE